MTLRFAHRYPQQSDASRLFTGGERVFRLRGLWAEVRAKFEHCGRFGSISLLTKQAAAAEIFQIVGIKAP
jgi:hypothetical protein